MKAINIEWDVDCKADLKSLPSEIEIPEHITDTDEISDYLSAKTGFCHKGFELSTKADIEAHISNAIAAIKLIQDIAKKQEDVVLPFEGGFFAENCDKTILEALELQKEKVPQRSESGMFYICPNCNKFIEKNERAHGKINIPHCKWCGQKINWENKPNN